MMDGHTRQLDDEALRLFARKGHEGGLGVPQAGEANAVKVRRVMQLTADLSSTPFERLRILDLGCGEGVYAIEAGLRGAEVVALDARTERMDQGAACAARHGLDRVSFRRADARELDPATLGEFDVVFLLGLLYHLDAGEAIGLLETVRGLCGGVLLIDTLVSPGGGAEISHRGRRYQGEWRREHDDTDPPEVRLARLLRSIDTPRSFLFTRPALVRALRDSGFSSVLECHSPAEPGRAPDRLTLAALAGAGVQIGTYPWVNGLSDPEIAERLGVDHG